MQVVLYILRENGRPLSYAEVKSRPRLRGRLVMGAGSNPEVHAKLFGPDWPDMNAPKLEHARVMRISNGCILLYGFQQTPSHPHPRQTWLCALDEQAGEAALRKIRPPTAADMPLAGFLEEDDDLQD